MENQSEFPKYEIWTAHAMIPDLFGLNIERALFEEWASYAIDKIGMYIELVKVEATVQEEGYVKLPCEAKIIKAVTSDLAIYSRWNAINIGEDDLKITERFYWYRDGNMSDRLPVGSYLQYRLIDSDTIKVDSRLEGDFVYILLYTYVSDGTGWPMFTMKQIDAMAWYVAYLYVNRQAFRGITLPVDLKYVKEEAFRKVAASKIPEYVSDNRMDQILDSKFSFNRKRYGRDYSTEGTRRNVSRYNANFNTGA